MPQPYDTRNDITTSLMHQQMGATSGGGFDINARPMGMGQNNFGASPFGSGFNNARSSFGATMPAPANDMPGTSSWNPSSTVGGDWGGGSGAIGSIAAPTPAPAPIQPQQPALGGIGQMDAGTGSGSLNPMQIQQLQARVMASPQGPPVRLDAANPLVPPTPQPSASPGTSGWTSGQPLAHWAPGSTPQPSYSPETGGWGGYHFKDLNSWEIPGAVQQQSAPYDPATARPWNPLTGVT